MPSSKPWLDGPSPQDQAKGRIWQGAMLFMIGAILTVTSIYVLEIVWIWTIIAAISGLFWMLTGLVTLWTGYE